MWVYLFSFTRYFTYSLSSTPSLSPRRCRMSACRCVRRSIRCVSPDRAVGVFVVAFVFLNFNVVIAFYVTFTIAMVVTMVAGIMPAWSVELNPLSSVNLVMAVGLGVEFTAHVSRFFMVREGTREERIKFALHRMGNNVVSGALSSLAGIVILAFARYEVRHCARPHACSCSRSLSSFTSVCTCVSSSLALRTASSSCQPCSRSSARATTASLSSTRRACACIVQ